MASSILITGAGLLGSVVARYLLNKGYLVRVMDSLHTPSTLPSGVEYICGDIRNPKAVSHAVKGRQYIVHTAAILSNSSPQKILFDVNVNGTNTLLRAARLAGVTRVIYISSTEVYGTSQHPDTEEQPLLPRGNYAESKVLSERLCQLYAASGLSITVLRPRTLIGKTRPGPFSTIFRALATHSPVYLVGDGSTLFQFLSVDDLAVAIWKSLDESLRYSVYNIGSEHFGTWRDAVDLSRSLLGSHSLIVGVPTFGMLEIGKHLPVVGSYMSHLKSIGSDSYVTIKKAKRALGWKPRLTDAQLLTECCISYQQSIHT